jgi:hypothetical protein
MILLVWKTFQFRTIWGNLESIPDIKGLLRHFTCQFFSNWPLSSSLSKIDQIQVVRTLNRETTFLDPLVDDFMDDFMDDSSHLSSNLQERLYVSQRISFYFRQHCTDFSLNKACRAFTQTTTFTHSIPNTSYKINRRLCW